MTTTWTDLLHDGTLVDLSLDWESGRVVLVSSPRVQLVAS